MPELKSIYQLKTTNHEKIVCPDCNGEGTIYRSMWPNTNNKEQVACPLCRGKRVVVKKVTTHYEAVE
jgi:DNA-directed RNA polymerase subunit RPC12/RpoP